MSSNFTRLTPDQVDELGIKEIKAAFAGKKIDLHCRKQQARHFCLRFTPAILKKYPMDANWRMKDVITQFKYAYFKPKFGRKHVFIIDLTSKNTHVFPHTIVWSPRDQPDREAVELQWSEEDVEVPIGVGHTYGWNDRVSGHVSRSYYDGQSHTPFRDGRRRTDADTDQSDASVDQWLDNQSARQRRRREQMVKTESSDPKSHKLPELSDRKSYTGAMRGARLFSSVTSGDDTAVESEDERKAARKKKGGKPSTSSYKPKAPGAKKTAAATSSDSEGSEVLPPTKPKAPGSKNPKSRPASVSSSRTTSPETSARPKAPGAVDQKAVSIGKSSKSKGKGSASKQSGHKSVSESSDSAASSSESQKSSEAGVSASQRRRKRRGKLQQAQSEQTRKLEWDACAISNYNTPEPIDVLTSDDAPRLCKRFEHIHWRKRLWTAIAMLNCNPGNRNESELDFARYHHLQSCLFLLLRDWRRSCALNRIAEDFLNATGGVTPIQVTAQAALEQSDGIEVRQYCYPNSDHVGIQLTAHPLSFKAKQVLYDAEADPTACWGGAPLIAGSVSKSRANRFVPADLAPAWQGVLQMPVWKTKPSLETFDGAQSSSQLSAAPQSGEKVSFKEKPADPSADTADISLDSVVAVAEATSAATIAPAPTSAAARLAALKASSTYKINPMANTPEAIRQREEQLAAATAVTAAQTLTESAKKQSLDSQQSVHSEDHPKNVSFNDDVSGNYADGDYTKLDLDAQLAGDVVAVESLKSAGLSWSRPSTNQPTAGVVWHQTPEYQEEDENDMPQWLKNYIPTPVLSSPSTTSGVLRCSRLVVANRQDQDAHIAVDIPTSGGPAFSVARSASQGLFDGFNRRPHPTPRPHTTCHQHSSDERSPDRISWLPSASGNHNPQLLPETSPIAGSLIGDSQQIPRDGGESVDEMQQVDFLDVNHQPVDPEEFDAGNADAKLYLLGRLFTSESFQPDPTPVIRESEHFANTHSYHRCQLTRVFYRHSAANYPVPHDHTHVEGDYTLYHYHCDWRVAERMLFAWRGGRMSDVIRLCELHPILVHSTLQYQREHPRHILDCLPDDDHFFQNVSKLFRAAKSPVAWHSSSPFTPSRANVVRRDYLMNYLMYHRVTRFVWRQLWYRLMQAMLTCFHDHELPISMYMMDNLHFVLRHPHSYKLDLLLRLESVWSYCINRDSSRDSVLYQLVLRKQDITACEIVRSMTAVSFDLTDRPLDREAVYDWDELIARLSRRRRRKIHVYISSNIEAVEREARRNYVCLVACGAVGYLAFVITALALALTLFPVASASQVMADYYGVHLSELVDATPVTSASFISDEACPGYVIPLTRGRYCLSARYKSEYVFADESDMYNFVNKIPPLITLRTPHYATSNKSVIFEWPRVGVVVPTSNGFRYTTDEWYHSGSHSSAVSPWECATMGDFYYASSSTSTTQSLPRGWLGGPRWDLSSYEVSTSLSLGTGYGAILSAFTPGTCLTTYGSDADWVVVQKIPRPLTTAYNNYSIFYTAAVGFTRCRRFSTNNQVTLVRTFENSCPNSSTNTHVLGAYSGARILHSPMEAVPVHDMSVSMLCMGGCRPAIATKRTWDDHVSAVPVYGFRRLNDLSTFPFDPKLGPNFQFIDVFENGTHATVFVQFDPTQLTRRLCPVVLQSTTMCNMTAYESVSLRWNNLLKVPIVFSVKQLKGCELFVSTVCRQTRTGNISNPFMPDLGMYKIWHFDDNITYSGKTTAQLVALSRNALHHSYELKYAVWVRAADRCAHLTHHKGVVTINNTCHFDLHPFVRNHPHSNQMFCMPPISPVLPGQSVQYTPCGAGDILVCDELRCLSLQFDDLYCHGRPSLHLVHIHFFRCTAGVPKAFWIVFGSFTFFLMYFSLSSAMWLLDVKQRLRRLKNRLLAKLLRWFAGRPWRARTFLCTLRIYRVFRWLLWLIFLPLNTLVHFLRMCIAVLLSQIRRCAPKSLAWLLPTLPMLLPRARAIELSCTLASLVNDVFMCKSDDARYDRIYHVIQRRDHKSVQLSTDWSYERHSFGSFWYAGWKIGWVTSLILIFMNAVWLVLILKTLIWLRRGFALRRLGYEEDVDDIPQYDPAPVRRSRHHMLTLGLLSLLIPLVFCAKVNPSCTHASDFLSSGAVSCDRFDFEPSALLERRLTATGYQMVMLHRDGNPVDQILPWLDTTDRVPSSFAVFTALLWLYMCITRRTIYMPLMLLCVASPASAEVKFWSLGDDKFQYSYVMPIPLKAGWSTVQKLQYEGHKTAEVPIKVLEVRNKIKFTTTTWCWHMWRQYMIHHSCSSAFGRVDSDDLGKTNTWALARVCSPKFDRVCASNCPHDFRVMLNAPIHTGGCTAWRRWFESHITSRSTVPPLEVGTVVTSAPVVVLQLNGSTITLSGVSQPVNLHGAKYQIYDIQNPAPIPSNTAVYRYDRRLMVARPGVDLSGENRPCQYRSNQNHQYPSCGDKNDKIVGDLHPQWMTTNDLDSMWQQHWHWGSVEQVYNTGAWKSRRDADGWYRLHLTDKVNHEPKWGRSAISAEQWKQQVSRRSSLFQPIEAVLHAGCKLSDDHTTLQDCAGGYAMLKVEGALVMQSLVQVATATLSSVRHEPCVTTQTFVDYLLAIIVEHPGGLTVRSEMVCSPTDFHFSTTGKHTASLRCAYDYTNSTATFKVQSSTASVAVTCVRAYARVSQNIYSYDALTSNRQHFFSLGNPLGALTGLNHMFNALPQIVAIVITVVLGAAVLCLMAYLVYWYVHYRQSLAAARASNPALGGHAVIPAVRSGGILKKRKPNSKNN